MKVAIIGSRSWTDSAPIEKCVAELPSDTTVISGGARGADQTAARRSKMRGLEVVVFKAKWALYGRYAGLRRNIEMAQACDRCVAFWDGMSPGTRHMISEVKKLGKPVEIITR